jgi:hypothetical protein
MSSKIEMKQKEPHPLDFARSILQMQKPSIAEIARASGEAKEVREASEAAIEAKDADRAKAELGEGSANDLEAKLESIDKDCAALKRRRDIAATTEAALNERLTTARVAETERAKRAAYREAIDRRELLAARQTDFLERFGQESRAILRESANFEIDVLQVNQNLPEGESRVPSVEAIRRVPSAEPAVRVREFKMLVDDADRQIGEEGTRPARRRLDGRFDVDVPNGRWADGTEVFRTLICKAVDWVEVTTTTRRALRLSGPLAGEIAIPAVRDGDPVGWAPINALDGRIPPEMILQQLDYLESQAPGSGIHHETTTQTMSAHIWRNRQAAKGV